MVLALGVSGQFHLARPIVPTVADPSLPDNTAQGLTLEKRRLIQRTPGAGR